MEVIVGQDSTVAFRETDDLNSLNLVVVGSPDVRAALLSAGLYEGAGPDADHLWLNTQALRDFAAQDAETGSDWADRWDAMISFAGRHGWTADEGRRTLVHVVQA